MAIECVATTPVNLTGRHSPATQCTWSDRRCSWSAGPSPNSRRWEEWIPPGKTYDLIDLISSMKPRTKSNLLTMCISISGYWNPRFWHLTTGFVRKFWWKKTPMSSCCHHFPHSNGKSSIAGQPPKSSLRLYISGQIITIHKPETRLFLGIIPRILTIIPGFGRTVRSWSNLPG